MMACLNGMMKPNHLMFLNTLIMIRIKLKPRIKVQMAVYIAVYASLLASHGQVEVDICGSCASPSKTEHFFG